MTHSYVCPVSFIHRQVAATIKDQQRLGDLGPLKKSM